jgi:tetratricopeptide (TPR) repeat protein
VSPAHAGRGLALKAGERLTAVKRSANQMEEHMKHTRHVTEAVLLLAGIAAVGCSKTSGTVNAKANPAASAAVKPVATAGEKRSDGEGSLPTATPKITLPMSFGDGQAAYQARKYSDATAIFDRYTTERPANAWGHYMLGLSAWKSGDLTKSEQAFEKALSVDPQHVKSLVNLSRVLIEQKRHDEAVQRLSRAAEIDPESTEVYRLLGRAYLAQEKTDEAVSVYRRAIELNELDAWSMNNLGLIFLETGRAGEALPLLTKAAELRPEVPAFNNNLGMALEHMGDFGAAATAYKAALAADPGYAKAKRNLERVEAIQTDSEETKIPRDGKGN